MQILWVLRRTPEFRTSECATRFQILTPNELELDISVDMEVSFEIEIFSSI